VPHRSGVVAPVPERRHPAPQVREFLAQDVLRVIRQPINYVK
jgi:hypothetical protein